MIPFLLRRPVFAGHCLRCRAPRGPGRDPDAPHRTVPEGRAARGDGLVRLHRANASAVENAVTTPLEEAINVEGLRSMTSVSSNDGSSSITVTFNLGRDLDAAQSDVQP
jgi:hydrophobic/amphiphilic exporter-1 (mainly G- bacteria), HAE1 family